MHLILYFNGTGNEWDSFSGGMDYVTNPDVKTIVVKGCRNKEVCNTQLFPNLPAFAKRFTTKLFKKNASQLTLASSDLSKLKIGIVKSDPDLDTNDPITGITLCGYSRGAVTCFNVAKELNTLAPNILVNIVANQPVPGNCYQGPGTNAASVADCSNLKNIRNVTVILGAYTGKTSKGEKDVIHRCFYSQIIPKLPSSNVKRDLIVIPKQHHDDPLPYVPSGTKHLHMQIANYLSKDNYVTPEAAQRKEGEAAASYGKPDNIIFPRAESLQSFFGLKRDEVYRHVDKLHPTGLLREGMGFNQSESLIEWWKKHDRSASRFSTQLTKDLAKQITTTNKNDQASLIALFNEADKWLILKDGSPSSRYYQVTAL
ncbi:MAG TPA: hypothetical protein VHZ76_07485, partial [Gammaproteobacteria bacterium]|nr:hypothetical protein [Gammaproteobacteria bacterium]